MGDYADPAWPAAEATMERIRAQTFARAVELHAELGSTNDRAATLAADPRGERPLLIWAEQQTSGRGRGANRWWSAPGSLTFSLLVDAEASALPASAWPRLSLAMALAVGEALSHWVGRDVVRLKWPNDVYLGERKVCGILIELPRSTPPQLVLGVGVNVDNAFADAPEEVRRRAIALVELTGQSVDACEVLIRILQQTEASLHAVARGDRELYAAFRRQCLLTGKRVVLATGSRRIEGLCRGIDDDGALVLDSKGGRERFFAGVVEAW